MRWPPHPAGTPPPPRAPLTPFTRTLGPPPPPAARSILNAVYHKGKSCTRFYYMTWYEKFKRAMGPFAPPLWMGPAVPIWNKTHDALVDVWREERRRKEALENGG